jgi:CRISPR-associated endonuclease/helicase Cas3
VRTRETRKIHFWAKTIENGKFGISVFEHMVNVGCVARYLAETEPMMLKRFELPVSIVGALAALHDLGKISPGFQQKCESWLIENSLVDIARNWNWQGGTETDHGRASHAVIQEFLIDAGWSRNLAMHIATVLGAHHGRIKFRPEPCGIRPPLIAPISEEHTGIDWQAARIECARQIWDYFGVQMAPSHLTGGDAAAMWWLAGLTTVADWIGSDERFFSPAANANDPTTCAMRAVKEIGITPPVIKPGLTFEELFGFSPNDTQSKALAIITSPGVYVIEAPMGMGKTEAALGAAYQLMISGQARGIYFALPTQATSNRIYLRMNDFLKRIAPDVDKSQLIHSNSWLMARNLKEYAPAKTALEKSECDARSGRDWFASAKRALLAPFGVGTIDQALLGVVAAKHFFVRHFALAGKVVIIDEVHSYDVFTGALVDVLVKTLEQLGCTVIILTATLTAKRRAHILAAPENSDVPENQFYPLLSGRSEQCPFLPIAATPPISRKIMVEFLNVERALDEAITIASAGGAVLWICNTVGTAQQHFLRLQKLTDKSIKIGLLHSRMIFSDREKREEEWMNRLGKNSSDRSGSILVSTQVVEQSVDLDADLLITELAPTDMLLQRLGRLWRHERKERPISAPRGCIIQEEKSLDDLRKMPPKAILRALGAKARVYSPYVLLRTLEEWQKHTDGITIPDQIRELIEQTYCEPDNDPESWQQLCNEWFGTDSAKKFKAQMSTNIWQPALDDQEGVQTRLNEIQTISLILCTQCSKNYLSCIDGSETSFGDEFSYETARVLHKNLVKVPQHHFTTLPDNGKFREYLSETHTVGIVGADGIVKVKGLKDGIALSYTEELGLVVNKSS